MRTTGSLLFFRLVAAGIMLFASLFVAADIFWAYEVRMAQPLLPGGSGQVEFFHVLYPPILLFGCGAMLYVLVEIATRLGRSTPNPFRQPSEED